MERIKSYFFRHRLYFSLFSQTRPITPRLCPRTLSHYFYVLFGYCWLPWAPIKISFKWGHDALDFWLTSCDIKKLFSLCISLCVYTQKNKIYLTSKGIKCNFKMLLMHEWFTYWIKIIKAINLISFFSYSRVIDWI